MTVDPGGLWLQPRPPAALAVSGGPTRIAPQPPVRVLEPRSPRAGASVSNDARGLSGALRALDGAAKTMRSLGDSLKALWDAVERQPYGQPVRYTLRVGDRDVTELVRGISLA